MPDISIADVRAQYPQYNDMSDSALADALHSKHYSDMPKAEFEQKIGLKPADESSTAGDIAKSFGSGLVRGAAGIAGLGGDIAELGTKAINYATGSNLQNKVPLATSQMVLDRLAKEHGVELHQPQGIAGQYAQTLGEFAPGALVPGGVARSAAGKIATQAVAPALASETAGQLTKGTAAEPYARIAGGLAGGALASRAAAPKIPATLTAEEIKDAGVARLKSPDVENVVFKRKPVEDIADQTITALRREKFNDSNAGSVFKQLEDLKTPVGPDLGMNLPGAPYTPPIKASVAFEGGAPMHTYEDFQATRTRLSDLAGKFGTEQSAAATKAIKLLDQQLENIPQSWLHAGDAQKMNQALKNFRADYSSGKTIEKVQEKMRNAELQAASANSGANVENATRQKLRPLLTSAKGQRGFTEQEQAAIENAVRGSYLGNKLRATGNYVRGNMGLGAAAGAFVGSGGNPLPLAAPLVGTALKKMGTALQRRQTEKIIELIKQRSPTAQAHLRGLLANYSRPGILPWPSPAVGLLGAQGGSAAQ